MNEQDIRQLIREELSVFIAQDRYTFRRDAQFFDGRNIILGGGTGTKFGTSITQKLGFYNKTPVVRQSAVTTATTQGGTYNSSDANTIVSAVNNVISTLQSYGLLP